MYDRRPPVVRADDFPPFAEPGHNFRFRWTTYDNAAVEYTVVELSGAVVYTDTTHHRSLPLSATREVTTTVAPDALLGDSIVVRLIGVDYHGFVDTLHPPPIVLRDISAPVVQMLLAPHPYEPVILDRPVYVAGDTIRATVTALDEFALAWVGWFIVVPPNIQLVRDSVAVGGLAATVPVEIVVPPDRGTEAGAFVTFARDSTGNLTVREAQVWVLADGVRRPYVAVPNNYIGPVADLAYDDRRHRVYLSYPEDTQVVVLDAGTGSFDPPIAMPAMPMGMDLLPGNDTLVVVLAETPYLALVDLTGPSPAVDTLRLHRLGYPQRMPLRVRIAADRQAFIALHTGGVIDTAMYVVDFATGDHRLFPELGWGDELYRSGDRSTIMTYGQWGYVYRTDTDSVEVYSWIYLPARPDLDRAGRYALSGHRLYDLSFQWLSTVVPESQTIWGWAISGDAQAAYYGFADEWGYRKVRLSDGSLIERVPLPGRADRLIEVGDGRFLLVGGRGTAPRYIVDLR